MKFTTKGRISWCVCYTVLYSLAIHLFQVPWLETPILFDIRAKPRSVASLTGTKGPYLVLVMIILLKHIRFANGEHHLQSIVQTIYLCVT